jgi:N-acetylglutamate synthase-like GNAT family acetyltransferase
LPIGRSKKFFPLTTRESKPPWNANTMSEADFQVRRATLDDLPKLRELWRQAGCSAAHNERRLTDFQVALTSNQQLAGCIGLQIAAHQGRIHCLAWNPAFSEEEIRILLWQRVQSLARNHGLVRLWTQEKSLFWRSSGFQEATDERLQKFPSSFGPTDESWLTLQLMGESHPALAMDQQFELFKMSQQELTEKAFRQARIVKVVAWCIFAAALMGVLLLALRIFKGIQ